MFFNHNPENCIFNLDFKNAFNSISRNSINKELLNNFVEVLPFFHNFYSGSSDLVFNEFNLFSSSGVKQGNPLGPFLFCLAIHSILIRLKERFPTLEIVAYMDDVSLIAPIDIIHEVAPLVADLYAEIGLELNAAKCFLISKRYADRINLLNITSSSYLIALRREVTNLPPSIWSECFPSDIQEIPAREVVSLNLVFKKLQQRLVKVFEQKDYIVRLSLAKNNNPAFANFLLDLLNSTASAFFSQIPQVYGLLFNDHQWTTTMRLRCFLWPYNLPHDLICKCSKPLNFNHLLNCNHFITYRSILHDAVRD
ncbi:hypothetical protein RCL1_007511 [Eukaryota sp. TZLM3-RCL]